MEQRPLRLGDILDDYCPRERRVTNHAVVAMIGDDVKQTRCTTCDSEHVYKGGRQPRRRKKDAPAALYREVLAGLPEAAELAVAADAVAPSVVEPVAAAIPAAPVLAIPAQQPRAVEVPAPSDDEPTETPRVEEGPVHRRLIRATLPRPEGVVKEARPIPEFTMHRNGARHGQFRGAHQRGSGGNGNGNGHGQRSHGRRFAGGSNGTGSGFSGRGGSGRPGGFRGDNNSQRPGGGGKKRSR